LLRKIVTVLVLVPLAAAIIALAVANRQTVTVSLDPFNTDQPAASLTLPLFGLVIALLIVGVLVGGAAAWLGQGKWRQTARRLQREVNDLRGELNLVKPESPALTNFPVVPEAPQRLKLRPPAR
jgi:Lipopolysaccharide assembly protein A domain